MYPHHKSGYTARCGKYEEERMKTSRKIGKIPQTATNDYNPAHAVQKETWRREKIIQSGCKQNRIIIRRWRHKKITPTQRRPKKKELSKKKKVLQRVNKGLEWSHNDKNKLRRMKLLWGRKPEIESARSDSRAPVKWRPVNISWDFGPAFQIFSHSKDSDLNLHKLRSTDLSISNGEIHFWEKLPLPDIRA